MHAIDFKEIQEKLSDGFRPWQRSFQFWVRATDIYTGYKVFQFRMNFVKDVKKQEEMWETQHELAAHKIYSMCSDLGGFFLKIAQILGKPDLAPAAWVRKLVTLCDQAPATSFDVVRLVLEKELGKSIEDVFETFDDKPLGSASIAQVHRARVKGDKRDVVVKVQHPGVEKLMMVDIRNLQIFALYMQKTDIKFDLFSMTKEIEKQIGYEFDFKREANAMEKIRHFLYNNNRKSPVLVPRVLPNLVTRKVLVMDYISGIPILSLSDEMARRGINPHGKMAEAAKFNILNSLSQAYGQMILKSGFFHADPHPGNILICKGSEVALLDYGQVKELPDHLRLGYANLVIAIADNNASLALQSFRSCDASGGDQSPRSMNVREQDRFLPIANISRIMKRGLPLNGKIAKDAKETMQECVSEFISFVTSEASDKCQREKRKTINGDDLLWAMSTLGFEEYIDPLKVYLMRYREMEGDTKGSAKGGEPSGKRDGQPSQVSQFAQQGSFSQGPYGNPQGSHMMVQMPGTE